MCRKLPFHVIQAAQRRWLLGAQRHLHLSMSSAMTCTAKSLRSPLSTQAASRAKSHHATLKILSPSKGNPAIVTPALNKESSDAVLVAKGWLEAASFQKLIGSYRKHNKHLGFDSSKEVVRSFRKLEELCSSGKLKLRSELRPQGSLLCSGKVSWLQRKGEHIRCCRSREQGVSHLLPTTGLVGG